MKKVITIKVLTILLCLIAFSTVNFAQDNCATAIANLPTNPIGTDTCATTIIPFSTNGFTFSGDTSCAAFVGTDYWYQWTATSNSLVWSTFAPGWPYATIYAGTCGNLTEVAGACTFQLSNDPLTGWNIGDVLLIQIQDFGLGVDVEFCFVEAVAGCTIPTASNYNPAASADDGSCDIPTQNCETAIQLNGCEGAIVGDTIFGNVQGAIATGSANGYGFNNGGDAAKFYVYEAPGNGTLQINNTTPGGSIIGTTVYNATNPDIAIHDLGPGNWTGTAADAALCTNAADPATFENTSYGVEYSSSIAVTAGNVYLLEFGNEWAQTTFDWDWQYSCEAVSGVLVSTTTTTAAQVDFNTTTSNGTAITANVEYGPIGFTPGSGTTINGIASSPFIITGLSPGIQYDAYISYPCNDGSGCSSFNTQFAFTTQSDCITPNIVTTPFCISTGFFSLDVQVTNVSAFAPGLAPSNPSGFNVFVNSGPGTAFFDTGVNVNNISTPVTVSGPFTSGSQIGVQLVGIDEQGCPSVVTITDIDCSCFGFEPPNDDCINATSLFVDVVATCDGISAPYTLACASVDANDPGASCFNPALVGLDANVWFTFVAPAFGIVTISTDYTGGVLEDTEIALYSGTCGSLTEIGCSQDAGLIVPFNSVISTSNANALIAGDTYFVQVDRWGTSPDESFCIDVIDNAIPGCTDSTSPNFDANANVDDGSCNTGCVQILNIVGLVATGLYEADDVITSNGQINTSSGGPVTYNAGANAGLTEYIELTSGFDADGTVDFTAINIECDSTD